MSINAISSNNYALSQINQLGNTRQARRGGDNDGDNDGSRITGAGGSSGGPGALIASIFQALSQAGISGTSAASTDTGTASAATGTSSASAASTPAQDPLQALGAFMHNLFAALQGQGGQTAQGAQTTAQGSSDGDGDSDGSANEKASTAVSGATGSGRHHSGNLAKLESNLQSLIQQLSTSPSAAPTTGSSEAVSASGGTPSTAATNAAAPLQQSYQNLLSALGASGKASSLGNFLQALSQNLQGIGTSGNVVNTHA